MIVFFFQAEYSKSREKKDQGTSFSLLFYLGHVNEKYFLTEVYIGNGAKKQRKVTDLSLYDATLFSKAYIN